ncbi:glycosyltransferase [Microlunatus antarcticus]|uniref:Poly(Glycerol-phosphate) alpha-glucosyltransferase n=2 Tax=Actinomycetes TaxID=1760 RepID=A0A7W5JYZ2_9ACTN|nr:poly(glycerol-phosphate) alpha-glucosyltransferase [Microlunatus antarcticus]
MSEELPPARQLVTTWWVPEQYAGQTTATLRRVGEQVQRSGRPVDLLTFSALQDSAEITERLTRRGTLPEGVTVRTLFSDLRAWEAEGVLHDRLAALPPTAPADDTGAPTVEEEGSRWCLRTYDEHRELVHSQMFRADGSLLARDFPVEVDGEKKRYQQFFDATGAPTVLAGSTWDVYYLWLDHLVGDGPAVIVNESKSTARFLSRYLNPRATTIHVFHESHLADASNPYLGDLYVAHRRIMPHLDRFDAVVFLTDLQRRDVAERFGAAPNLHAVPNAGPPVVPEPPAPPRSLLSRLRSAPDRPERGVVVATLKPLKRIEHAVRAVALVQGRGGRAADFGLDVYGKDAGSLASIEATVAETGSAGQVVLHGYAPGAARHFADASFSLVTSTTEGQSLVLLESMAAGCVPIAYDIRYGPAELLVDGETGFLVPGGDVSALADTIERFLSLPTKRVRELRANARERLSAFSDAEVFRRWVGVQQAAVAARARRLSLTSLRVPSFTVGTADGRFSLEGEAVVTWDAEAWTDPAPPPAPTAAWLLVGRETGRPWRRPLTVDATAGPDGATLRVTGTLDPLAVTVGGRLADVYLEVTAGSSVRRLRLNGPTGVELGSGQLYSTAHGNVSLRKR